MPDNIKEVKLLFRASRNGWNAVDFHRLCDNKGPVQIFYYLYNKYKLLVF